MANPERALTRGQLTPDDTDAAKGQRRYLESDLAPRPGEGEMDEEEFRAIVHGLVTQAKLYVDEQLSPDRAMATDYWFGRPLGNEEEGRSQVVMTEVRDAIRGALPSLIRVIFGPERPAEYIPETQQAVAEAEQATEYFYYVLTKDNDGFLITEDVLQDGMRGGLGVFKWAWDESQETKAYSLHNVTEEQLQILGGDEDIELTSVKEIQTDDGPRPHPPQPGQPPAPPQKIYAVSLTRQEKDGRVMLYGLPPEELIVTREARGPKDAFFIGHRTRKTRGALIALGIDEKLIDEYTPADGGQDSIELSANVEEIARNPNSSMHESPEMGDANTKLLYVEGYTKIDFDGDGIPELRRICTIGSTFYPVVNEPIDEIPLSVFVPIREPHTLIGMGWFHLLKDIQRIRSNVMRANLDSLAMSIFPRTWYKEGDANVEDVLNTAVGAPIRTKSGNGAVGEFGHTYVGKESYPMLSYLDDVTERRTGQNKGVAALDADALQSTTKSGVDAAVTNSQGQLELLIREFVETAFKPMMRGVLKLLVKHQPRARVVRLTGGWTEVDPRPWNADMDVHVNVSLGAGLIEQRLHTLAEIKATQEQVLAQFGPQNPLVTVGQYRHTLAKMLELRGFKDTDNYFNPLPVNFSPPAPPPPQDPTQMVAQAQVQIEQMRAQRELAIKEAELQLKRQEMWLNDQRQREAQASKIALQRAQIMAQFGANINEAQLDAVIEHEKMRAQAMVDMHETTTNAAVDHANNVMTAQQQPEPAEGGAPPAEPPAEPVPHPEHAKRLAALEKVVADVVTKPKKRRRKVTFQHDPETNKVTGAMLEEEHP